MNNSLRAQKQYFLFDNDALLIRAGDPAWVRSHLQRKQSNSQTLYVLEGDSSCFEVTCIDRPVVDSQTASPVPLGGGYGVQGTVTRYQGRVMNGTTQYENADDGNASAAGSNGSFILPNKESLDRVIRLAFVHESTPATTESKVYK